MQILVKTLTGKTITLDVESSYSVWEAKVAIESKTSVRAELVRLVYQGKELEDSVILAEYRIEKESTLHMALRLRGGAGMRACAEPLLSSASGSRLVSSAPAGADASCGGGSRRPYRWWADRRLVAENAV